MTLGVTPVERTWECKCGSIKARLTGDPLLNLTCHCHSCVAAAQFIEGKTSKSGTSMLHNDGGGACASLYSAGQVEFLTQLSSDDGTSKLKFVRVGESGNPSRCYTTCCGTQMNNCLFPRMIAFNRNGIKNADGSPYNPAHQTGKVPLNIMKNDSFDPASVPEPNHGKAPLGLMMTFMGTMMNPFGKKFPSELKELFPEKDTAEIVPITWEEK